MTIIIENTLFIPGSFEVLIDEVNVFSKLKEGLFPDFDETASVVESVQNGNKPTMVTNTQSSSCTIF